MQFKSLLKKALFLSTLAVGIAQGGGANSAILTVTNTNDSGPGSLRQAILDANTTDAIDHIVFSGPAFLSPATITLLSDLPPIPGGPVLEKGLLIEGPTTAPLTISGEGHKLFEIGSTTPTFASVEIHNLNITGGVVKGPDLGGGAFRIHQLSVLKLSRSAVYGNKAIEDGGMGGFGGGILNQGFLFVHDSTISGNEAKSGGGIASAGPIAELKNVTVVQNKADDLGGGGIVNLLGLFQLGNSLIALNTDAGGQADCSGGFLSLGYNLIQNLPAVCAFGPNLASNIIGVDPLIGPLQDNGGTKTHALLAGSPALNAGNPGSSLGIQCNDLDQRGVRRPQGVSCDIGAYEFALEADVGVSLQISPNLPQAGSTVTLTTTVTNNGPSESVNVELSQVFAGLENVSTAAPGCSIVNISGQSTLRCRLGTLAASQTVTIPIQATVGNDQRIKTQAAVAVTTTDLNLINNNAELEVEVVRSEGGGCQFIAGSSLSSSAWSWMIMGMSLMTAFGARRFLKRN